MVNKLSNLGMGIPASAPSTPENGVGGHEFKVNLSYISGSPKIQNKQQNIACGLHRRERGQRSNQSDTYTKGEN